jgi:hypothetical protein
MTFVSFGGRIPDVKDIIGTAFYSMARLKAEDEFSSK